MVIEVPPLKADYHSETGRPHNLIPSSIVGLPNHYVENILLENIQIQYGGNADKTHAEILLDDLERIPEAAADYPEFSMFGELPAWGLYIRHAKGVTCKKLKLSLKAADFRSAIVVDDAPNLNLYKAAIGQGGGEPLVVFKNSPGATLKNPIFYRGIKKSLLIL